MINQHNKATWIITGAAGHVSRDGVRSWTVWVETEGEGGVLGTGDGPEPLGGGLRYDPGKVETWKSFSKVFDALDVSRDAFVIGEEWRLTKELIGRRFIGVRRFGYVEPVTDECPVCGNPA